MKNYIQFHYFFSNKKSHCFTTIYRSIVNYIINYLKLLSIIHINTFIHNLNLQIFCSLPNLRTPYFDFK